ncbi:MAG TPA: hypothetical protein VGN55_11400 [Xanthobacteraceae bacterium]|jgi:hypothetical protein
MVMNVMTSGNSFKGARIRSVGMVRGVDEGGHDMFRVERTAGPFLYGEYFEVFEENENDFNIEIGAFGFTNEDNAGNPYPSAREHFSAEECSSAQELVQQYFSNPRAVMDKWEGAPHARFLGGVRFRPDWIIRSH